MLYLTGRSKNYPHEFDGSLKSAAQLSFSCSETNLCSLCLLSPESRSIAVESLMTCLREPRLSQLLAQAQRSVIPVYDPAILLTSGCLGISYMVAKDRWRRLHMQLLIQ